MYHFLSYFKAEEQTVSWAKQTPETGAITEHVKDQKSKHIEMRIGKSQCNCYESKDRGY